MSAYHPLNAEEAIRLAKSIPGRFPDHAELECREIGDGNLNLVFHVTAKIRLIVSLSSKLFLMQKL